MMSLFDPKPRRCSPPVPPNWALGRLCCSSSGGPAPAPVRSTLSKSRTVWVCFGQVNGAHYHYLVHQIAASPTSVRNRLRWFLTGNSSFPTDYLLLVGQVSCASLLYSQLMLFFEIVGKFHQRAQLPCTILTQNHLSDHIPVCLT